MCSSRVSIRLGTRLRLFEIISDSYEMWVGDAYLSAVRDCDALDQFIPESILKIAFAPLNLFGVRSQRASCTVRGFGEEIGV